MKAFCDEFSLVLQRYVGPEKPLYKSVAALARSVGTAKSNITRWTSAKHNIKEPSYELLSKVSVALGYDQDYLHRLWRTCAGFSAFEQIEFLSAVRYRLLPKYNAGAGQFTTFDKDGKPMGGKSLEASEDFDDPHAYAVVVSGDSMTCEDFGKGIDIRQGDTLIVCPNIQVENGDVCVCVDLDTQKAVVKIYTGDKKGVHLKSSNQEHDDLTILHEDLRHYSIHRVAQIKRNLIERESA